VLTPFSTVQEIYPGCCTVAAYTQSSQCLGCTPL
jgi:hypothetical protein